jgi:hypothetical protein
MVSRVYLRQVVQDKKNNEVTAPSEEKQPGHILLIQEDL